MPDEIPARQTRRSENAEMRLVRQQRRAARLARRRGEVPRDEFEVRLASALSTPASPRLTPLWLVFGAKAQSMRLDGQLADGLSPETSPLLIERAAKLADPRGRRRLADNWLRLLDPDYQAPGRFDLRVPLNQRMIWSCDVELRLLAETLTRAVVAVRGVAMANLLLTDGAGPVYNPASPHNLGTLLSDVIRSLDPNYTHQGESWWRIDRRR